MHLVLNAADDAAHEKWLRETPGAYEWWYFDARSDCGVWAVACIWFLGNPFSPYYRHSARGEAADPFAHNALFFALYRHGTLHAYHFTRYPREEVAAPDSIPGALRLGPNSLTLNPNGVSILSLADENANGRRVEALLRFDSPPLLAQETQEQETEEAKAGETHFWLPAAPSCRVSGQVRLRGAQNADSEEILLTGHGYHDHNWGRLPFEARTDWYWARATLGEDRAVILYHVRTRGSRKSVSHLLLFESGRLLRHDSNASVTLSRRRVNGFGLRYATRLAARSGSVDVRFELRTRLDSAPFYLRVLCDAEVTTDGVSERGQGIGEYFRPEMLAWPVTASATKARIVVR